MRPRAARVLSTPRLVGLVASLVAVAFVVGTITDEWDAARHVLVDADPAWLALGWVLALGAMGAMAVAWRPAQRVVEGMLDPGAASPLGWFDTVTLYFQGELGKYVPGAIWATVGRAELARR